MYMIKSKQYIYIKRNLIIVTQDLYTSYLLMVDIISTPDKEEHVCDYRGIYMMAACSINKNIDGLPLIDAHWKEINGPPSVR